VRHPTQDRIGHRRPRPLPLHQLLGGPLKDKPGDIRWIYLHMIEE